MALGRRSRIGASRGNLPRATRATKNAPVTFVGKLRLSTKNPTSRVSRPNAYQRVPQRYYPSSNPISHPTPHFPQKTCSTFVFLKDAIRSEKHHLFRVRLCDQHSVEWVRVDIRQVLCRKCMKMSNER